MVSPSKEVKLQLIQDAFQQIQNDLEEHEKRGHYLFKIVSCKLGVPL